MRQVVSEPQMNGKTAKAIRRFATKLGLPYAEAKKKWKQTPWPIRHIYRQQILQEIRDFAFRLKRWRGHKTQKEAADLLGVPFDTYVNWEYSRNYPSGPTLAEIERRMAQKET